MATLVLLAGGLIAGCESGGDIPGPGRDVVRSPLPGAQAPGSAGPSAAASAAPSTLPGLAERPVWSVVLPPKGYEDDAPQLVSVGATVVVSTPVGPRSAGSEHGVPERALRPQQVELREPGTGVVRKSFRVYGAVTSETWQGRSAIVVRARRVIPADGLTQERRDWRIDAYDEQGTRIGGVELAHVDGTDRNAAVVDGWIVSGVRERGRRAVSVVAAGSPGPGVRLACGIGGCDPTSAYTGSPFLIGDTALVSDQNGPDADAPGRVTAYDVTTGGRRWSTDEIAAPEGADSSAYLHGLAPTVVGRAGGSVVVAWRTGASGTGVVLGLHDRLTGALVATGPRVPDGITSFRTDAAGTLAVACGDRCAVWDVATGRTLWQQAKDEFAFVPRSVVGGVVYGVRKNQDPLSSTARLALDARTRQVLSQTPPDVTVTALGDRWALVSDERVVHVYAVRNR